ncbi:MerR family DNA-binding transcriptional regulator [Rhodovulum tesquicola]|uniref:MerR family transcriptional regulator n=1 Tax=Rhodovulum tesquicola TaxID=540254 RepID=UPI0020973A25|nr:MerR family DNA-binding transcriptional regulator [Rhodovulum tesquicola]MCO8146575.1 MerR family DNA-binding transcriptional regulator [Rhodovulum tesquicola]
MTDDLLSIRQMCEAYSVTPRTLRFYESIDLLNPIREGQRRLYTRRDRGRLTLILRGKRFGFSLEQIRQLLALYDEEQGHEAQHREAYAIGRERLADMQRQRAELDEAIAELQHQLALCEEKLAEFEREARR